VTNHPLKIRDEEITKLKMDVALWQTLTILMSFGLLIVGVVTGVYIGSAPHVSG
jgi:hypothetical protein